MKELMKKDEVVKINKEYLEQSSEGFETSQNEDSDEDEFVVK